MIDKCANSSCAAPFKHFREGRIYGFDLEAENGDGSAKPTRAKEFFWLCGPCADQFTLASPDQRTVTTIPRRPELAA